MKKIQSDFITTVNALEQAVVNFYSIRKVYLAADKTGNRRLKKLISILKEKNISISYLPPEKIQQLTGDPRAVLAAEISEVELLPVEHLEAHSDRSCFLLLEGIEDAGNLGAILRAAAAFQVEGVILTRGCAPVRSTVWKNSAGGVSALKFYRLTNLFGDIQLLKEKGFKIVALSQDATLPVWNWKFDQPAVFCFGNEHRGLAGTLRKNSDLFLKIPQTSLIESLNVSQAVAIVLSFAYFQKGQHS